MKNEDFSKVTKRGKKAKKFVPDEEVKLHKVKKEKRNKKKLSVYIDYDEID